MNQNRLILAGLAMLLSLKSNAQREYNEYWDWRTYWIQSYPVNDIKDPSISQVTITTKRPGKKKTFTAIKRFNEKGLLIEYCSLNKKGVEEPGVKLTYDEYGHELMRERYKKGKLKAKTVFVRKKNGEPLSVERTNAKKKIQEKSTWTYNSDNCLTESIRYKKNGKDVKNKWVYEYYDKCKKSKTMLYNSKGKIKKTWSFDCKEEGEKLVKRKNETQVCKWEESSAQYLTKVYQAFDEKGHVAKYVTRFTIKDTLPVEHTLYDEKDRIKRKASYNKSFSKPLNITFYRKGKPRSEAIYTYKDTLLLSQSWTLKGKFDGKEEFAYESIHSLKEIKRYDKRSKVYNVVSISYLKR